MIKGSSPIGQDLRKRQRDRVFQGCKICLKILKKFLLAYLHPMHLTHDETKAVVLVTGVYGFAEQSYFCICTNVFKSRRVCRTVGNWHPFFPPPLAH